MAEVVMATGPPATAAPAEPEEPALEAVPDPEDSPAPVVEVVVTVPVAATFH